MNLAFTFKQNILIYISFVLLIGILSLLIYISPEQRKLLKVVSLNFSVFYFLAFVFILEGFKKSVGGFQFVTKILWIPVFNLNVTIGIDRNLLFFVINCSTYSAMYFD